MWVTSIQVIIKQENPDKHTITQQSQRSSPKMDRGTLQGISAKKSMIKTLKSLQDLKNSQRKQQESPDEYLAF